MKYDVAIIGAGPAGLMAARTLSKTNINFIVVDSKKEIGPPLKCGEGTRTKGFIELFNSLDHPFIKNRISYYNVIYKNIDRTFKVDYIQLDRPQFEKWLALPAIHNLKLRTECKDIVINKNFAEIITNKGTLKSNLIILANGCSYAIQKKLKLIKNIPLTMVCYGGIIKNHSKDPKKLYFYFDSSFIGGFWIFPKNKNIANAGIALNNPKENIKQLFSHLLKKHSPNAKLVSSLSGIYPCSGPLEKTFTNRLMVCGDAAGMVHAGTGEGIYYALKSGKLAAMTAIKALQKNNFNARFLKQYEEAWKKSFAKELHSGIIFSDLMAIAFKHKKLDILLKASKKDVKKIIIDNKFPLKAKIAWRIATLFNLQNKKKIPSTLKILWRLSKFIKRL